MKRLSPRATWWLVVVAVAGALNVLDAVALRIFELHRPTWTGFVIGVMYGFAACRVADHFERLAKARDEDPS